MAFVNIFVAYELIKMLNSIKYAYFARNNSNYTVMVILADKKIPKAASDKLHEFGEVIQLETKGITYDAISGHPDVFFCRVNEQWVVAPNLPGSYIALLEKRNINFVLGELPVGSKYPESARYNAVSTENYLFHNFRYTDSTITMLAGNLDLVHISQGYSRCNLLPLGNDRFITSDEGILRVLDNYKFDVLPVHPKGILLPGFEHGFFGGTAGIKDDMFFIIGNLDHFNDGEKIRGYLDNAGYRIIELYDGPLFDGGSLLFL